MIKLDVIGKFRYREPKIQQVSRAKDHYPVVTLYGDLSLKPFFAFFQQVINTQIALKSHREHSVVVETIGKRFRLTVDQKKTIMVDMP